jgi:hypothetical protein
MGMARNVFLRLMETMVIPFSYHMNFSTVVYVISAET